MKEGENFTKETEILKSLEERLLDIEIEKNKEFDNGMAAIFVFAIVLIYFIAKGYLK